MVLPLNYRQTCGWNHRHCGPAFKLPTDLWLEPLTLWSCLQITDRLVVGTIDTVVLPLNYQQTCGWNHRHHGSAFKLPTDLWLEPSTLWSCLQITDRLVVGTIDIVVLPLNYRQTCGWNHRHCGPAFKLPTDLWLEPSTLWFCL